MRTWCDPLGTLPIWKGEQTPVFVDEAGEPLLIQWVNKTLTGAAAVAGISKPVSSHIIRKSVGTPTGRENPKFAQLQLGISADVYNEHYNQPILEDRMAKRDILPGSKWKPTTPEEIAGSALLDLTSGKLPRDEFNERVARARPLKAQPEIRKDDDVGYQ